MDATGTPDGKGGWGGAGTFGGIIKEGIEGGSSGPEEIVSVGGFHGKDILQTE